MTNRTCPCGETHPAGFRHDGTLGILIEAQEAIERGDVEAAIRALEAADAADLAEAWQGASGKEKLSMLTEYFGKRRRG